MQLLFIFYTLRIFLNTSKYWFNLTSEWEHIFRGLCSKNMLGCLPYRWTRPHVTHTGLAPSAQSRRAVTKNRCNVHDCIKLGRGFSQLSFMYVLFSFNICFYLSFPSRVIISPPPPVDHNRTFGNSDRYAVWTVWIFLIFSSPKVFLGSWWLFHDLKLQFVSLLSLY